MKNTSCFLAFSTVLLFAGSCTNNRTEQQPEPAGRVKAESVFQSDKYKRAMSSLANLNAASSQSGLTALLFSTDDANAWQKLDVYYQKVDALPYSAAIKQALKKKAIFGLVEMHQFLEKAPLEKRTYYADQFFAQQRVDPKLAIVFLENLRAEWPTEKLAVAKDKANQQLQADMARANRKLPENILLPNTEEVRKALANVEKDQLVQAQKLQDLQRRLAAL